MNEFEIISPDGEDINITALIPETYSDILLKGAHSFRAECSFGDLLFNHYAGDGYDIWKSNYMIARSARVIGRANVPLLEFSVMYENSFSIDWKKLRKAAIPYRQIELYHAPYMENTTYFKGGRQFTTVDLHYHKSMLEQYVKDFKLLGKFMEKVDNKEHTQLFDGKAFSCARIDQVVKEMISYKFVDELAPRYYDSYAHVLLILLLEKISGFDPSRRSCSGTEKDKATEAKRLLTTEFGKAYTIKELCEILQTNPYQLKASFKSLFGVSIGQYKKSVLMEQARVMLETTSCSIDEISFRLGYSSQQSFSTAFRNYYKRAPTDYRKRY